MASECGENLAEVGHQYFVVGDTVSAWPKLTVVAKERPRLIEARPMDRKIRQVQQVAALFDCMQA